MGRHTVKRRRPGLIWGSVAALVAVCLVAGGGIAWASGSLGGIIPTGASTPSCDTVRPLAVVADPAIAPVMAGIAAEFDAAHPCTQTTVKPQASADTASVLAAGNDVHADIWVPDSAAWRTRTDATAASLGRPAPTAAFGDAVATTPVVFAAPAAQSAAFAEQPVGWSSILDGSVSALLPDPEGSGASLAALGALGAHAPGDDARPFAGAMIALGRTIPRSLDAALVSAESASTPTVVVTTEQAVASTNSAPDSDQFLAIYPSDGTTGVGFPFVRVGGESTGDEKLDELIASFEEAVHASGDAITAGGFREGDGTGVIDAPGVVAQPVVLMAGADGASQLSILRSWGVLNLRSRMLAAIDVSGSMEEPSESGLRRIDIFQQAASGALQKFSGEVELGVWVFSTQRDGEKDWEDLAPIAPLGDAAHSEQIAGIIGSLPDRLGGATGLYDTTLAGVKNVRDGYDASKVNSLLVITDGRNEDENGITLDDLLAQLEEQADPDKPVPVIMIGFGPDTDLDAMTKIAKATGGAAYSATKPEDLGDVLVDALSQRSCRPDC
ncbi:MULTISPECIES: VWA domain-containing protein [unclassified Leifsonia]|uniref:VWA domain-containing protein n=1 Tax=unclassified Leifsonia TaxID=2663824 RepID=UPI000ADBC575|nr:MULTISPECIES: VWA domain-containing protein [unclassified Leifsonia]